MRTAPDIFSSENDRLTFVFKRDGLSGAIAFAKQGLATYGSARKNARTTGRGYGSEYRFELVCSMLYYRNFLRFHVFTIKET